MTPNTTTHYTYMQGGDVTETLRKYLLLEITFD